MGSGSEGFAALLSDLKERSGLSYGVLAKRLHVGTSTLHRYVQGETVPPEYGVIEKFARLTGASAAEMAELYRLWMAAVEARSSTAAEAAVVGSTVPEEATSVAPVAPAVPTPSASVPSVPSTESSSIELPPVGPPDAPAPAGPVRPTSSVPSRGRRRLLPALAVLAVLGVGGAVAGVAFASSGSGSRPTAGSAQSSPQSPSSPSPSMDSAASGSAVAPTSSSTSSTSSSASSAPQSSPSTSSSPAASAPPIAVTIRPSEWEDKCDQWYLLNKKPNEVPPPPPEQDARGWASALGAVPAGTMKIALNVQGTSSNAVVLSGLHVRTLSKAAALPWTAFSMAQGCGSGLQPVSFDINLDVDRPLANPKAGQQGDSVIPAQDFPFKVSQSDPQVLTVYAHAHMVNVAWYLELDWSSGSRSGTVRIDDHGKPFQTSGAKGRPIYDYDTGSNSWLIDTTATVQ